MERPCWRGQRGQPAGVRSGHRSAVGQVMEALWERKDDMPLALAPKMLAQAGMTIVQRRGGYRDWWLAVPNQNPLIWALFDGSSWGGTIGAGLWTGRPRQSLQDTIQEVAKARINGGVQSCMLIPLAGLSGEGGIVVEVVEGG